MAWKNDLGRWGEDCAAEYMEQHGWYIRHRNWQKKHHELDLVCIDENSTILLFIEVKTRASEIWGAPDEAIDLEKKNNTIRAARAYISDFHLQHLEIRYDTISVIGTPETGCEIRYKENVFDVESQFEYYNTWNKKKNTQKRFWNVGVWKKNL